MAVREYAGHKVAVDEDGFLVNRDEWDRDVAQAMADERGMGPLTPEHWKVIDFCRADAAEQGTSPGPRRIVAYAGVSMKDLFRLFPKGPGKLAALVAGIKKPTSCV
jgi:TusE/DsrC/DsvC family sulfur relay protein